MEKSYEQQCVEAIAEIVEYVKGKDPEGNTEDAITYFAGFRAARTYIRQILRECGLIAIGNKNNNIEL